LGDESIRRYIILYYFPQFANASKKCIRTFDAFVEVGKKRSDKADEIVRYCNRMCTKPGTVVFTASNIKRTRFDNETHFQSYIVDNDMKRLLVVDPAFDSRAELCAGIYTSEVSHDVVIPFYQRKGYDTCFVSLSTPAQIHIDDVFCQSWTLYILLAKLQHDEYKFDLRFDIPLEPLDKYDMLLTFYRQLFADMPELGENLRVEYEGEILESRGPTRLPKVEKEALLRFDPVVILMALSKYEMKS
jgi:hypothetical protein